MYKARAIITHDIYEPCYIYHDKEFDTHDEVTAWVGGMDGFLFAQGVMVGIDTIEQFEGYKLEAVEPEKVEA